MKDKERIKQLDEQIAAFEAALKTIQVQQEFIDKLLVMIKNQGQPVIISYPCPIYPTYPQYIVTC